MNQKKAKALRKKIYGTAPKRNPYKYKWDVGKDLFGSTIQCLRSVGKRAKYQAAKEEMKNV